MKFKIVCLDPEGREEIWTYDNANNEIFDNAGIEAAFPAFEGVEKSKYSTFQGYKREKVRKLHKLRIQVGTNCNYNCEYCCQAMSRNLNKTIPIKQVKTSIVERLKEQGIELAPKAKVGIWGGEPLVYWKTLKKLVPEIRKTYSDSHIYMITNGSLLTKEMADFFIEHKVRVVISHDAQGFCLRNDKNPLDDPKIKEVWQYLFDKTKDSEECASTFNLVLTPKNSDVIEIQKYFSEHFMKDTVFNIEGPVTPNSDDQLLTNFEEFVEGLAKAICSTTYKDAFGPSKSEVLKLAKDIYSKRSINTIAAKCDVPREDSLIVDMQGNIIACHNFSAVTHKIGELNHFDDVKQAEYRHFSTRPHCNDCLVIHSCKGSCPLMNDEDFERACRNQFFYHYAVFCATWFLLFQRQIVGFEVIK